MPPRISPPTGPIASGSTPSVAIAARPNRPVLQTSKEWIVPPRPKPGRKSTKVATAEKTGAKSSQKAFKERRQEYVGELEEKVRQLEAGEGEKCVFYQQQAQRAKAESTTLLAENDQLRRELDKLRKEVEGLKSVIASGEGGASSITTANKGKSRSLPTDFEKEDTSNTSKRPRRSAAVRAQAVVAAASSPPVFSSSASLPRRRSSNASYISNQPSPSTSHHSNSSPNYHQSAPVFAHSPLHENHPASPVAPSPQPPLPTSHLHASSQPHNTSCGFCSTSTDCLCAEIGYEYTSSSTTPSNLQPSVSLKLDNAPSPRPDDPLYANESTFEPAVPLRLATKRSKVQSVWRIDPPVQDTSKFETVVAVAEKALCSGDPSNCPACSDDPFGKAFCTTLAATVCSTPCANCPGNCTSSTPSGRIPTPPPESHTPSNLPSSTAAIDAEEAALFESLTDLPCCGDPELCGSLTCQPASTPSTQSGGPTNSDTVLLPRSVEPGVRTVETVPCNEAWSVLKAHPNIAFANLQMLAEVVSKRTHCSGPVASPSTSNFGGSSPQTHSSTPSLSNSNSSLSARPQLAPQSMLQCQIDAGVRKRLTVERGAVNEALELLDRAAARGGSLRK
ncbi:uncharacterized protein JCM6883_007511 [Sporobolomyces salmoneus]|uniref:uncharacterized protein n=1 Tax=Sporobolomyces salmoneus TaxID=183962 RepID=UPI00317E889C